MAGSTHPRTPMQNLAGYDHQAQRSAYRPIGEATSGELSDMMTEALALALEHGASQSLINITAMHGFASPGPAYRRWRVRRWAALVADRLRVALVVREEHLCPEKTGLLIAAEEGMKANIFVTERDALAWLDCG